MADSSAKLPLDSPGARMYVGVPMSRRTSRCFVSTLSHWYWCRETSAAGSMKSSKREVVETLSCLSAISFPSLPAATETFCRVRGRPPTIPNICGRESAIFTGRPSCFAASAAINTCDHAEPLQPNPPPTNLAITRTLPGGTANAFASFLRTPKMPWVAS